MNENDLNIDEIGWGFDKCLLHFIRQIETWKLLPAEIEYWDNVAKKLAERLNGVEKNE